jgi:hypothetical protein
MNSSLSNQITDWIQVEGSFHWLRWQRKPALPPSHSPTLGLLTTMFCSGDTGLGICCQPLEDKGLRELLNPGQIQINPTSKVNLQSIPVSTKPDLQAMVFTTEQWITEGKGLVGAAWHPLPLPHCPPQDVARQFFKIKINLLRNFVPYLSP